MYSSTIFPFFSEVQLAPIFTDSKTFVDCVPKYAVAYIIEQYNLLKQNETFCLSDFVHDNFDLPKPQQNDYISNSDISVEEHIQELWPYLLREPDANAVGSLIQLPHPYIVPGGRFGEIYYWDSYFTMLGLAVSGETTMIENMVKNFAYLIDTVGYIPNGNRTYYLGRSQPPFFAGMVKLLEKINGSEVLQQFLPYIQKEYNFWMDGLPNKEPGLAIKRLVCMDDGTLLNRYYDENDTPRPESFKEDIELSKLSKQQPATLFRNLRAAAESGWDFSSRWFKSPDDFGSIHTTDIIPIDLNSILYFVEKVLSEGYLLSGDKGKSEQYNIAAENRKKAIQKYCWDETIGFYFDYDFVQHERKNTIAVSGFYPLYFNIANQDQAAQMVEILKKHLLRSSGVLTTTSLSGQQWDAPNGWAPMHWIIIKGLLNYGYKQMAFDISQKWLSLNKTIYKQTGSMMEKYNIIDSLASAGGGEYPGQDGFGWTNGVYLALTDLWERT